MPEPSNATIMAKLESVGGDVTDMKSRLFGNGQPGVIRDVAENKSWRMRCQALHRAAVFTLLASSITGGGGLLYWLLVLRIESGG